MNLLSVSGQQTCPRCTPLCQNGDGSPKTCGDDGCGNLCGTCANGQSCCSGTCVCSPNCVGRQCGDDGCGGNSCGTCSPSQTCSNGVCIGTATPNCAGKQCGNNQAGGSCGSCPLGQRCRTGQCECYYDCNERNCGNAVQPEGTNFGLCPQRPCGTCPSGFTCGTNGRCSAQTPCTVTLTVVDCSTRRSLSVSSSVFITSTTFSSYSSSITVAAGSSGSWSTPGIGEFKFQTSASGYTTNTQSFNLTSTTTLVELCVSLAQVQIDLRNILTNTSIEVPATVTYTGVSSGSIRWTGLTSFNHGGFGSYSFTATPDSRYSVTSLNTQITATTSIIIIYLQPLAIQITVVDCSSRLSLSTSTTVVITSTTTSSYSTTLVVPSGSSSPWSFPSYGTFLFQSSASGYTTNSLTQTISTTTTSLQLCLTPAAVPVILEVRYSRNNALVEVPVNVSYSGVSSGSIRWTAPSVVFNHGGFGTYTFQAVPERTYSTNTLTTQLTNTTTLITIYVPLCGDQICHFGETNNTCSLDCTAIALDFGDSITNAPVSSVVCNYFSGPPRDDTPTGPMRNSLAPMWSRIPSTGSNVVRQSNITLHTMVYVEAIHPDFITFYWRVNTSTFTSWVDRTEYYLRVHLSKKFEYFDSDYRFVNSWLPTSVVPFYTPYAAPPIDLNLHVFHNNGSLDLNHQSLSVPGRDIGTVQTDVNQSGGPATIDITPVIGEKMAVWVARPPHNLDRYPSQDNSIMASGSYVVIYGKTSDAPLGKQLNQLILDELNPEFEQVNADLWHAFNFEVTQPGSGVNAPNVTKINSIQSSTIDENKDMYFNCQLWSYCSNYQVPYADKNSQTRLAGE